MLAHLRFRLGRYLFQKFKEKEAKSHEISYLFWECTSRCNLNCLHCGSDCSKDSRHADMPLDDFLKAIDTIKHARHISLLNAGMGALTFSLDGLEENHNWLRNSTASFNKVDKARDQKSCWM